MENLDPPPPPPQIKDGIGKWRVFALRAASSLIWGGGWGFAVPFYFVQDCTSCFIPSPYFPVRVLYYIQSEVRSPHFILTDYCSFLSSRLLIKYINYNKLNLLKDSLKLKSSKPNI